jgi:pimeloyl-ACP methyl ester carboxylesterase
VIWLHPYSYGTGYSQYPSIWHWFLELGFGVMAFDQIGFGSRGGQSLEFYHRYPKWSLMGKMVTDVQAAISQLSSLDGVDRVFLMGYSLGAKLGLFTAALDERVAGVAAVCPFTPLRLDEPRKETEGVRHYSHLHGLLPRLGYFVGREKRLPVDYDEIVALIAPRPVLISAPTHDRFTNIDDVRAAVAASRRAYTLLGAADALTLHDPPVFNDFGGPAAQPVYDWLDRIAGPRTYMPPPQDSEPPTEQVDALSGTVPSSPRSRP